MSDINAVHAIEDNMLPALGAVTAAMETMTASVRTVGDAIRTAFDTAPVAAMERAVMNAASAVTRYRQELENVRGARAEAPQPHYQAAQDAVYQEPYRAQNVQEGAYREVIVEPGAELMEYAEPLRLPAVIDMESTEPLMLPAVIDTETTGPLMLPAVIDTESTGPLQLPAVIDTESTGKLQLPAVIDMEAAAKQLPAVIEVEARMLPAVQEQAYPAVRQTEPMLPQTTDWTMEIHAEQASLEMERLRGQFEQAVLIQDKLNMSAFQMDITNAGISVRKMDMEMSHTELEINSNTEAQEAFNQKVEKGKSAAGRLKEAFSKIVNSDNISKVMEMTDEASRNRARVNLADQNLGGTGNLQENINSAALNSGADYQATGAAMTGLGLQAPQAFSSADELGTFVEQINKNLAIAGTSGEGASSVMQQITQAMASGTIQEGDFSALLENAQPIAQNMADYMNMPIEQVKQLAAEGQITAEVFKNSMLSAAETTNAKFNELPATFGQVKNVLQTQGMVALQPILEQLAKITQSEGFAALVEGLSGTMQMLSGAAVTAIDMIGQAAAWAQENWSWLGPVIYAVGAAVLAYNAAMFVMTGISAVVTALKTGETAGYLMAAAAVFVQKIATEGLTTALLSCPLVWVALAIAAVIAGIVAWISYIGGLKVAWLVCVNAVMTVADTLQMAFAVAWLNIKVGIASMVYAFTAFKVGVLNALGNLKVAGLTILQSFINGAIERINALISLTNDIAGTSIALIVPVEFAANAAVEEEAAQAQRAAELAALKEENTAMETEGRKAIAEQERQNDRERMKGAAEIEAAKAESDRKKSAKEEAEETQPYPGGTVANDVAGNTALTAGNTAAMAGNTASMTDSMDMMDEELKYMRDAAEQEIINRFTLAELKVDVKNNNTLNSQMDLDDVSRQLGAVTGEILASAAEGGHF